MMNLTWDIDGWIIVAGSLCGLAAALLGNFLVLRRMSLISDAISHAVLPGIVTAFLLSGQRQGWVIFVGAALIGVLTVFLTELAREFGKVDEGAAIGVVFTFLFALGLVMIVQVADRVDLDPGCVLYGDVSSMVLDTVTIGSWYVPRGVISLSIVTLLNLLFVVVLYRPLKVSTFDPQLASSQGIPVRALHYLLASLVAMTSVAAFDSVGNILVVAMFVVPPVTAWLWTDRLSIMIVLSGLFAILSAVVGHLSAIAIPAQFGMPSTSTAGMMAVSAGGWLAVAALFARRKGLLSRAISHWRASQRILGEDLLGILFRNHSAVEQAAIKSSSDERTSSERSTAARSSDTASPSSTSRLSPAALRRQLLVPGWRSALALWRLSRRGWIEIRNDQVHLSTSGLAMAQNVVRAHRLWEQYLSAEAGLPESFLHDGAERLEHYTDRDLRERLNAETKAPALDPHGKQIPPEA